jgi:hypothetical protein
MYADPTIGARTHIYNRSKLSSLAVTCPFVACLVQQILLLALLR